VIQQAYNDLSRAYMKQKAELVTAIVESEKKVMEKEKEYKKQEEWKEKEIKVCLDKCFKEIHFRRPTFQVSSHPKLCNQFGTIFFGGPNNFTVDNVPAHDNSKIPPANQSSTCFGIATTQQNPIELAMQNGYELAKQNENEITKRNGNEGPKPIGNESSNYNRKSVHSIESGDLSSTENKTCCMETSWGTPFSCNYTHPIFMGAGKASSAALIGHALDCQVNLLSDKDTSTFMSTSNKVVENATDMGQVNEVVSQPLHTSQTNGHSVPSTENKTCCMAT